MPYRRICLRLLLLLALLFGGLVELCAQFYPIHGTVQWPAPQSPYLVDYYSGSRDRLIITLHNRDLQQPLLFARLRVRIKSHGFLAETREEMPYPMLELLAGTPTRLTATDLMPYLRLENLRINGRLREGKLPTGFTEFSVQVVDFYSGKVLSTWHTGRAYLDVKKPPILNVPERDEQVSYRDPIFIRFQWMPRHQGLAGTEYEFVLKELPDNGAVPQAAFAYGNEIYRVRTRNTFLNYTHLEPILLPNRRYAWQVQAIARDGIDEIGMFENRGFSEIYWFSLNENCPVPTGLKAQALYAKVDFSWNRVIGATGYMLACRPKTNRDIYEWSEVQSYGERTTIAQLKPGWTYEWRVGTLCTGDRPIYSPIQEVTLPKNNEELLASCGKEPPRRDLRQEPRLDVAPGDTITIGGDYPMIVTELRSLGDGWYSGRGKTSLRSIIEVPHVALRFDRLRINVDNFQIDGLVEAIYDDKKPLADLDKLDDGGKSVSHRPLRVRERKLTFALPAVPEMSFNPETGELETTDAEGKPQRIKLDLPEGGDYASAFPMVITDSEGNEYQVSEQSSSYGVDERSPSGQTEGDSVGGRKPLRVERVERLGTFDTEQLERSFGLIRFRSSAQARYALDRGDESWYLGSVKMDTFYRAFARDYIAPWKLIPTGERDVVEAYYDGSKDIDLSRVRFASAPDSPALPADYDEARRAWRFTLPATESNSTYEVFALYQGKVIGKLRVVSYPKQSYKLRLVPINGQSLGDVSRLSQQLNSIYNKHGVSFTLSEGEGVSSELKAKSLSQDLRKLQEDYEAQHSLSDNEVCIFILSAELSKDSKYEELEGLMPRGKRFGYIFAGNSPNEEALARTLAHELGHGLFTLQHTFDNEYGGKNSRGKTQNLMDYTEGATELVAFQWNVIANTAPFTALDREREAQLKNSPEDLLALQQLEEALKKLGRGHIGLRLRCSQYRSEKKPTMRLTDAVIIRGLMAEPYIVSYSKTYLYGILSLDSVAAELKVDKTTASRELLEKIAKTESDLLLLHFDEANNLRYCEADAQNYPGICKLKDFTSITQYLGQFRQDIQACRSSERGTISLSEARELLRQASALFGQQVDFALGNRVYRLNAQTELEEIAQPLSDSAITQGAWQGDAEEYVRLATGADGIIQFQAFGISSKLKLAKDKRADLVKVAQHIQEKSNAYLKQHQVRDFQDSPAKRGLDLNASSQNFADGDAFRLDNNAAYIRFIAEGYDAVKTLLKTSELPEKIYRSSDKDKVVIHAPGVVTGVTEAVAEGITDITSITNLAYNFVVEEETRQAFYNGLVGLKNLALENPRGFIPLLRDFALLALSGNSLEEWNLVWARSNDVGVRSHLGTRGVAITAKNTFGLAGAPFLFIPRLSDNITAALKRTNISTLLAEFSKLKGKGFLELSELPNRAEFKALDELTRKRILDVLAKAEDELLRELEFNPELIDELLSSAAKESQDQKLWLRKVWAGIAFNKAQAPRYPFNEVYVVSPKSKSGYVRLDSYDPIKREIVSRKYTQLAEINEETAIKYLKELKEKYAPGRKIAKVPSNTDSAGTNKGILEANGGDDLKGQMILEVPVQSKPIPQSVLDYARQKKIQIRDVEGNIYQ